MNINEAIPYPNLKESILKHCIVIGIKITVHNYRGGFVLCNANWDTTKCPDSRLARCPHFRGVD